MALAPSASASPAPPVLLGGLADKEGSPHLPGPQAADTHTPCLLPSPVLSPHISKPLWVFSHHFLAV